MVEKSYVPPDRIYRRPEAPKLTRRWSEVTLPEIPDGEVSLSIAIMHSPWRPERVENVAVLKKQLPDAVVIADTGRKGIWPTSKQAWMAYDKNATHHIVLQDDAILCQDFDQGAIKALSAQPKCPISFYSNKLKAVNGSWGFIPTGPSGVALCLPTAFIDLFLAWCEENVSPYYPHDDYRFFFFAQTAGLPVRFTFPSLVDHQSFVSANGEMKPERSANPFVTGSPLDIDWTAGVDMPQPQMPDIRHGLGETTQTVSVVMPYYKRIDALTKSLKQNAKAFQFKNIEVVLVLDEPTQQAEVLLLVAEYPKIKWRVIVNPNDHEWRNPARAINVGIKNAQGDFILICSPESVFTTDVIYNFWDDVRENSFSIGRVKFLTNAQRIDTNVNTFPYGSIFVKKSDLETIGGYDENLTGWGADDDGVRSRLKSLGLTMRVCETNVLVHYESEEAKKDRSLKTRGGVPEFIPTDKWGTDFSTIIYDTGL